MDRELQRNLAQLEQRLAACAPTRRHDVYVAAAIAEALAAARAGNIGVGAVIVAPDGGIVQRGRNHMLQPYFRSDLHAEMDTMNRFEERFPDITRMSDYALFSSLEPCPMCLTRLITSGVGKVFYAAPDNQGGLAHMLEGMPPAWITLAARQEFAQADCSAALRDIAFDVFQMSADAGMELLQTRRS